MRTHAALRRCRPDAACPGDVEAVEQEVTLASGWVGVYKRRKKGEGGDVYMTRPGEKPLRSTTDIQRYWGLVPAPTRGVVTDAE